MFIYHHLENIYTLKARDREAKKKKKERER